MAIPAWFDEYAYLTSKLSQLQSSGVTGYTTITQVKAAIEAAGMTTYSHYTAFSLSERTSPNDYFNTNEYLAAKAVQLNTTQGVTTWTAEKVALAFQNAGYTNAYEHFAAFGWQENVNPSNAFDVSSYLELKAAETGLTLDEVTAAFKTAGFDPISHYMTVGMTETGMAVTAVPDAEQVAGDVSQMFTLTTGVDTIIGTTGNDMITASTVPAGIAMFVATLNSGDVIDGGAGADTLNINVGPSIDNVTLSNTVQQGTVKNVEIININNSLTSPPFADPISNTVDAAKFEGATQIWQKTVANIVDNLGGSTTAGFRGIATPATFFVNSADAATAATVAFDGVQETSTLNIVSSATGTLNTVNVSGTVADFTKDGTVGQTTVAVTVGKDVQTLTVNTGVNTLLVASNGAGTKAIATVDASASTGAVDYQTAANTVATIKGGAGNDKLINTFVGTATANAATLNGGAGDDTLTLNAAVGAATAVAASVDGGEGKDAINVTINANVNYDVKGGAGDDTVVITNTVKTTDKIDGGDGSDSVGVAPTGAALIADDYIVFNKVLTNFETLKLTGAVTNLDASKLAASYTTLDLFHASTVDNVDTQAIISNGNLNAEAAGYINVGEGSPAATVITYAGTLNITDKGLVGAADAIVAHANTVNLTVAGGKANGVLANDAVLSGEAKTATITLSAGTDTHGTAITTDDTFVVSSVTVAQNATGGNATLNELDALTSLAITGNGAATVTVGDVTSPTPEANKLVSVDASGLNSVDATGAAAAGLTYESVNTAAETVKLGGGIDSVTLGASTYGKMDTVEGLHLVVAGGALTAASDTIVIVDNLGVNLNLGATGKMATAQTDLDLALKDAAVFKAGGIDVDTVAFQMGGNTYVYADTDGNNLVNATDTVVKLTGAIDLDALVIAL